MKAVACPHCGLSLDGFDPAPGSQPMQFARPTIGIHEECGKAVYINPPEVRAAEERDLIALNGAARVEVASLMLEHAASRQERVLLR